MRKRDAVSVRDRHCGECSHVSPVYRFHTLSVFGLPTLGTCPYWTESRCVLLSQKGCGRFKPKDICNEEDED